MTGYSIKHRVLELRAVRRWRLSSEADESYAGVSDRQGCEHLAQGHYATAPRGEPNQRPYCRQSGTLGLCHSATETL